MSEDVTPGAHVHVVRGTPDDMELAALVAGLAAVSATGDDADAAPRSAWSDRSRTLRGRHAAPAAGPDGWRWSLRG